MPEQVDELVHELSGYEKAFELAGDSVALTVLQNQDTAFYVDSFLGPIMIFAIFIGIGISFITANPQKIGAALLVGLFTLIFTTTIEEESIYINSMDTSVAIRQQPLGQLYLYKFLHSTNGYFNSFLSSLITHKMNGEPSYGIQRVLTNHYSSAILEMEGAQDLRRLWAHYVDACEGVAREGINGGHMSAADAGAIGLFGGPGLGVGYWFPDDLGEPFQDNLDGHSLTWSAEDSTFNGNLQSELSIIFTKRARGRASQYLWDYPAQYSNSVPTDESRYYPIYTRDYWIYKLAELENKQNKVGGLNLEPVVVPVWDQPFGEILQNPRPIPTDVTYDERFAYENHAYLDTCLKYYLAAESALTNYYDAIHDYTAYQRKHDQWWRLGFVPQTVEKQREQTRQTGRLDAEMHVARLSVSNSKKEMLEMMRASTKDNPHQDGHLGDKFGAFVEGSVHDAITWFEEWKNKFGILGALSIHIMLIAAVYISTPFFFLLGNLFGPTYLLMWVKLMTFAFVTLMINTLIMAWGMVSLYQSFVDASLSTYQAKGSLDTLFIQDVSWVSIYLGILGAMVGVDIIIASLLIFNDTGFTRRLSSASAGFTGAMGGVAMGMTTAAVYRTMGMFSSSGGGGGGGGGTSNSFFLFPSGSSQTAPPNPPSPFGPSSSPVAQAANDTQFSPPPPTPIHQNAGKTS